MPCFALPCDGTVRPPGSCGPTVAKHAAASRRHRRPATAAAEQKVPLSDASTRAPDDFGTWLSERGPDAYALA